MSTTLHNPKIEAYNDSVRQPIDQVVVTLRELLGAKLVAYIASVSATRVVRDWADGIRQPNGGTEVKLRHAYRIARLIERSEGAAIVPTWFQGMNPYLGDRSPARVLHESDFESSAPEILAAANSFVGS